MHYEPRKLIFSMAAWRAFRTETLNATATKGLAARTLGFNLLALLAGLLALTPFAGSSSEESIAQLNSLLGNGLFFILGPFVGFAVNRWWWVRKDGVGSLWGTVDDLSTWSASWFNKKTIPDRAARALVLRYGLLSHALLYKEARHESEHLDDLIAQGLLHEHEARALQPLVAKPLVVWAWMTAFWQRALSGALGTTPIDHAPLLAPTVYDRCMRGRAAIGTALAFIDTQQPFPYVHLLSLITDVALSVNAATVGLQAGRHLLVSGHKEAPLILACAVLRVAVFVLCITGLLAIDPADFPALAYQVNMKKECESFAVGVDAIDLSAGWWEGLAPERGASAASLAAERSLDAKFRSDSTGAAKENN